MPAGFEARCERHVVAHYFACLDPGGAELRTVSIVDKMHGNFEFYAVSGRPGALERRLVDSGYGVHRTRLHVRYFPRLLIAMVRGGYSVVHTHLGMASGFILLLAWLARVPVRIAHFRSDRVGGERRWGKTFSLFVSRWLIQLFATRIVGVSPGSLTYGWSEHWRRDSRCAVIPNGYDPAELRFGALASDVAKRAPNAPRLTVANVGKASPDKNRARAIEILTETSQRTPVDVRLIGSMEPSDERLANRIAASETNDVLINLVGFTDDVSSHLAQSDVLLVTSKREGLPGVVLEALALGVPVVATDLPGTRWIKQSIEGLYLCDLGSDNSVWRAAIVEASRHSQDEIRQSFDSSPFTMNRVLPEYCHLWGTKPRD